VDIRNLITGKEEISLRYCIIVNGKWSLLVSDRWQWNCTLVIDSSPESN